METIHNRFGDNLDYSHHQPADTGATRSDLVIIGHGVTANKDRPFIVSLAEALAADGYEVIRFSFSGNGKSGGDFRNSCPSREVDDLAAVIEAFPGRTITYVGHSMGGAVGVLALNRGLPVKRFVSLAGMVHTELFARTEFGDVTPDTPQGTMWGKPECPLSTTFLEDMKKIDSVLPMAAAITVPWLIVHGRQDDVIPIEHSRELLNANPTINLVELDGADHVFSENNSDSLMASHVIRWLGQTT